MVKSSIFLIVISHLNKNEDVFQSSHMHYFHEGPLTICENRLTQIHIWEYNPKYGFVGLYSQILICQMFLTHCLKYVAFYPPGLPVTIDDGQPAPGFPIIFAYFNN